MVNSPFRLRFIPCAWLALLASLVLELGVSRFVVDAAQRREVQARREACVPGKLCFPGCIDLCNEVQQSALPIDRVAYATSALAAVLFAVSTARRRTLMTAIGLVVSASLALLLMLSLNI